MYNPICGRCSGGRWPGGKAVSRMIARLGRGTSVQYTAANTLKSPRYVGVPVQRAVLFDELRTEPGL